jgi:hypothetical protein
MTLLAVAAASAVLLPVCPGGLWTADALPVVVAQFLLPPLATSNCSVIPAGGAIEVFPLAPKKPTTTALSRRVVTDGAKIERVLAEDPPELATTGAAESTPAYAVIPPLAPTEDENLQVKGPTAS